MTLSRRFVLLLPLAALTACGSGPPPRPSFAELRFEAERPLLIDIASIEVRDDYQPPFHPPNVEHLFPVPPARAVESWARDRLRAVGQEGHARFTISQASAIETELRPRKSGIEGALTKEPAQRYEVVLKARFAILDEHGLPVRYADAESRETQEVLDGTTPNEREQIWYDLTKRLMVAFDRQMTREIQTNFAPVLR